jgi:stage V sporulation protein G
MQFSVEKMFKLPDAGHLKAFCDVACDDVLVIKGIRVLEGKKGIFVSMPQEQGKDDKWYDQVIFKNAQAYERLGDVVVNHYHGEIKAVND